jgi:esterase
LTQAGPTAGQPVLHFRDYGDASGPPLIMLHGLFGSGVNWHGIARRLQQRFRIICPDLRNHGQSVHAEPMDYAAMSADLQRLMEHLDLPSAHWVGHSMGGKTAMHLALSRPRLVASLCVADIAPIAYRSRFSGFFQALLGLPLKDLGSRREADARLQKTIADPAIRGYLLQNLRQGAEGWHWQCNLPILQRHIDAIRRFHLPQPSSPYTGPSLFIRGALSDYIPDRQLPMMRQLFPGLLLTDIPAAGHWVYAEQPERFIAALADFLERPATG